VAVAAGVPAFESAPDEAGAALPASVSDEAEASVAPVLDADEPLAAGVEALAEGGDGTGGPWAFCCAAQPASQ
jgi:hypothetical protein